MPDAMRPTRRQPASRLCPTEELDRVGVEPCVHSARLGQVVVNGDLQRRKAGFDFECHGPGSFGCPE